MLAEAIERRGSSIDDYTAPDGDGAMQERLQVYQRTGEPCPRCGRPIRADRRRRAGDAFLLVVPAAAGGRPEGRGEDPGDEADPARKGRRWTELDGEGALGLTPRRSGRGRPTERAERTGARRRPGRRRARPSADQRQAPGRGGSRRGRGRATGRPDVDRSAVRASSARSAPSSSSITSMRRSPSATASASSARTGPARRRSCGSSPASTSPDGGEVHRKRGLTLGLLAQESHFDAAFMAAPDVRAAVRHGAGDLERMERELASLEAAHRVTEPAYAELQHRFEMLGGYTLDQRIDEALSGLGFSAADVVRPPSLAVGWRADARRPGPARDRQPGPAAARRADEPPRPRRPRVARGAPPPAGRARCWSRRTTGRSWTRPSPGLGAARPPADRRSGATTAPTTASARSATRGPYKDVETQAEAIAREHELVQRYRSHRKFTKMHEHEARLERLQAAAATRRRRTKLRLPPNGSLAAAAPARSGTVALRIEDLVAGLWDRRDAGGGGPRPVAGRGARRADRHRRPQRRRQDDAPADDRRRPAAARWHA